MAYTRYYPVLFSDSSGSFPGAPEKQLLIGSRSGEAVPYYRQKIAKKQDASSNFSSDRIRLVVSEPALRHNVEKYVQYFSDGTTKILDARDDTWIGYAYRLRNFVTSISSGPIAHDATVTPAMIAQAQTKLLRRINDQANSFGGFTFLGELRETIHMIRHPASALRKGVKEILQPGITAARKKVNRDVRRRAAETNRQWAARKANAFKDATAGTWLEFAFGVRPALNDTVDIAETAAKMVLDRSLTRGVVTLRSMSDHNVVRHPSYNGPGGWATSGRDTLDRRAIWEKESRAYIRFAAGYDQRLLAPAGTLQRIRELAGLDFRNLVLAGWELTPWSFLIDYFVNVGDLLDAALSSTTNVIWANRTSIQDTQFTFTGEYRVRQGSGANPRWENVLLTSSIDRRKLEHKTVTRAKVTPSDLLSIPLVFTIPGADSTKWYNMAALCAQMSKIRF